jgi:hypothetical protein
MGFMKLTENGTLNLTEYGFKQGDCIRVTCVGGGGGSNHINTYYDGAGYKVGYGGGGYKINTSNGSILTYSFGEPGEIEIGIIKLEQDINSIPITIGAGGTFNNSGGSTSFGTYLTSLGGISNSGDNAAMKYGYIPRTKSRYVQNDNRMETDLLINNGSGVITLEW